MSDGCLGTGLAARELGTELELQNDCLYLIFSFHPGGVNFPNICKKSVRTLTAPAAAAAAGHGGLAFSLGNAPDFI
jgi:hypothetical protein